jgi:hypothetical protein
MVDAGEDDGVGLSDMRATERTALQQDGQQKTGK